MKVCLDTNAYARLMQAHKPLQDLLERVERIFLPAVVLGELHAGFQLGARAPDNVAQLETFLGLPGVDVADTTADVAIRYGVLVRDLREAGTPLPTNDIWIAATAAELGARLVTYDAHFDKVPGLPVLAP